MDHGQVRTVLAVERTRSFTRAADLLHVTQSTITARVRQLEQELGVTIWDRTTRRLILTAAGAKLMPLFERADLLFNRIYDTAEMEASHGHLVFGSVHSQWLGGIIPLLTGWSEEKAGVTWRLVTGHSRELLEWLRDGTIDLAISYFPSSEQGLQSILLMEQRLALIGSPQRLFSIRMKADTVKEYQRLAYVEWGAPFTDWFRQEFDGWQPEVQVDQAALLIQILEQGHHVAFMPATLTNSAIQRGTLVEIPYHSMVTMPTRAVYLVSSERALLRPLVQDLWNYWTLHGRDYWR